MSKNIEYMNTDKTNKENSSEIDVPQLRNIISKPVKYGLEKPISLEHPNELVPIVCIVIGIPGPAKTAWIEQEANRFLSQQFSEPDNGPVLSGCRLNTCNEVAEELLSVLSDFEDFRNKTRSNFESVKEDIQNRLNQQIDSAGSWELNIDIMRIQLTDRIGNKTLWEHAKNISRIENPERNAEAVALFKKEFYEIYSKKIFSGNFIKRNDSICIATTGNSFDDIDWHVSQVQSTNSLISVVYLDVPVESALDQKQRGNGQVNPQMIMDTQGQINAAWTKLKEGLPASRIWRLFRLEPIIGSGNLILRYHVVENISNPSMLNKESQ